MSYTDYKPRMTREEYFKKENKDFFNRIYKKHGFVYEVVSLEEIEIFEENYNFVCDGDNRKINLIKKEDLI